MHGKIERKSKKKKAEGEEGGEGKKPKKAKKDGPKRPTSAYFYYSNERRAAMKAANPDAATTEIAKLLGARILHVEARCLTNIPRHCGLRWRYIAARILR